MRDKEPIPKWINDTALYYLSMEQNAWGDFLTSITTEALNICSSLCSHIGGDALEVCPVGVFVTNDKKKPWHILIQTAYAKCPNDIRRVEFNKMKREKSDLDALMEGVTSALFFKMFHTLQIENLDNLIESWFQKNGEVKGMVGIRAGLSRAKMACDIVAKAEISSTQALMEMVEHGLLGQRFESSYVFASPSPCDNYALLSAIEMDVGIVSSFVQDNLILANDSSSEEDIKRTLGWAIFSNSGAFGYDYGVATESMLSLVEKSSLEKEACLGSSIKQKRKI